MSIQALVADARQRLRSAGISHSEADLDAKVAAQWLLGWDAARLLTDGALEPPTSFAARYEALVERRARREPMAYICGEKEFWGLIFEISPAVLIPRPETELIVEAVLERFQADEAIAVADVGTGSGCLAVAIAHERPLARVVATDISADATAVAAANAARHGVLNRITFEIADLLSSTLANGPFDLIVSNPPYVPEGDRPALQREVRSHEPTIALFGGADGLAVTRRLIPEAVSRLKPGGWLIFEIGDGQESAIADLLQATPLLGPARFEHDLQDIPRTALVQRI